MSVQEAADPRNPWTVSPKFAQCLLTVRSLTLAQRQGTMCNSAKTGRTPMRTRPFLSTSRDPKSTFKSALNFDVFFFPAREKIESLVVHSRSQRFYTVDDRTPWGGRQTASTASSRSFWYLLTCPAFVLAIADRCWGQQPSGGCYMSVRLGLVTQSCLLSNPFYWSQKSWIVRWVIQSMLREILCCLLSNQLRR